MGVRGAAGKPEPGKMPQQRDADACLLRGARPGRDEDAVGVHGLDLRGRDLVVAADGHLSTEFAHVLDEVIGEGIVIVEHEDHV